MFRFTDQDVKQVKIQRLVEDRFCKNCKCSLSDQDDSEAACDSDATYDSEYERKQGNIFSASSSKSGYTGGRGKFVWNSVDDDSSDSMEFRKQRSGSVSPILALKTVRDIIKKPSWDYYSDETLDTECERQSVVDYHDVVGRRRVQHKSEHPEDYSSNDEDSKFRRGSLK